VNRTKKVPSEGFKQFRPPPIKMNEAVKAKAKKPFGKGN
jgi:hypothetical protein